MKTVNFIKFTILLLASFAFTTVFAQDTTMSNTTPSDTSNTTTTTTNNSTFSNSTATTDDSTITARVQKIISGNRQFSKAKIVVSTQNGVVILSGNLNSNNVATSLIQLAAAIKGVKDVDTSGLTVNNTQLKKDLAITAKVKGALLRERTGLAKNIKVQTNNGVVTLTGNVSSQDQADQAIQLAKSINGVDDVQSKITVKGKSGS